MWWILVVGIAAIWLCWQFRFMRVLMAIVAVGGVIAFFPLQRIYYNITQQDSSIIENYTAEFRVEADGRMRLKETVDVRFTETRRGIFRYYPEQDGDDPSVKHPVTVESVQVCPNRSDRLCEPESFTEFYEAEDIKTIRIGQESVTYPAGTVNRYIIVSTVPNALTQRSGTDVVQWYWDVIPQWRMQIEKSSVIAKLPVQPTVVRCAATFGECSATETAPFTFAATTGEIPPRPTMSWQADMPPTGLNAVVVTPSSQWWKTWWMLLAGVVLAVLLALGIRMLRERKASEAPAFAAPSDDVLTYAWAWREDTPNEPFQALLLQLREKQVLELDVDPQGQMTDKKPEWVTLHRTSAAVPTHIAGAEDFLTKMGLTSPGSSVRIDKDSVTVGKQVREATGALSGASRRGAASQGFFTRSAAGLLVHLAASSFSVLAIVVMIGWQQPYLAAAFAIPGVVGIFSDRSLRTKLSESGLAARDAVTGLRTALSTKASVERYDYALKARYFAQFLPWAVALDCADKWADACKPDTPEAQSDPAYHAAQSSYWASQAVSTAVASVSAGAVAAYAATQSSSSGGGGGFSAGGGSGGGGGGSW